MKKRLFAIMLALAMLLVAVPALAEGEVAGTPEEPVSDNESVACTHENESVKYVDNEDGTHTVTYGCGETKTVKHIFNDDGKCVCGAQQPAASQPEGQQPATNEPAAQQPAASQPEGQQPATNEPSTQQPTDSQSGGQNPHTSDGEGGGEQPANTSKPTCNCINVKYEQYATEAEGRFTHHKKVCTDCGRELAKELHQWDENTKKPKTEGTNIPTCTNGGDWTVQCGLCGHVTVFDGPALGHDYEYHWGTWDCKTKTITAYRKCKRARCTVMENPTTISVSEKGRDTWYSCGKKYTTVSYKVTAAYSDATVEYGGKAECTYSSSDYCRPDWYYDPCYYNNPCGHWGCGNVCTRYSNCVPCRDYRTTFRVGGYNCLATPKTGDVSVMAPAILALIGAAGAALGKKRR